MSSIKSADCPNCGGVLMINPGEKSFFCQYCGSHLLYDDGVLRIEITQNIHKYDEARIRELEYKILEDERKRRDESHISDKWKKTFLITGMVCLLVLLIAIILIWIAPMASVILFWIGIISFVTTIPIYLSSKINRENRTEHVSTTSSQIFGMHVQSEENVTPLDKMKLVWMIYGVFAGVVSLICIIALIVIAV